MSQVEENYWWIYPKRRKQISLLKIPKRIADNLEIHDGKPISISICGKDETDLYKGPVSVTSDCEIYLPKNVKEMLKGLAEAKIIINSGVN